MTRLRYQQTHWARETDQEKSLEQYLELGDRVFNKTKFTLVRRLTGDVTGKRLLDYGGGAGIMAVPFASDGAEVVIVDAEEQALKTAMYYAGKEKVAGNLTAIQSLSVPDELKDQKFDVVIAKDIIEHIEDDSGFLHDLSQCQGRGGRLILSTQNRLSLNYLLEGSYQKYRCGNKDWCGWDSTHLRFYTYRRLKGLLADAGYRTIGWGGVYIIPYDIMSWLFLLKINLNMPFLHKFDLLAGALFPFNRLGWAIIVSAEKAG